MKIGQSGTRSSSVAPWGGTSSRTMIVITIAMTASLNASSRDRDHARMMPEPVA